MANMRGWKSAKIYSGAGPLGGVTLPSALTVAAGSTAVERDSTC